MGYPVDPNRSDKNPFLLPYDTDLTTPMSPPAYSYPPTTAATMTVAKDQFTPAMPVPTYATKMSVEPPPEIEGDRRVQMRLQLVREHLQKGDFEEVGALTKAYPLIRRVILDDLGHKLTSQRVRRTMRRALQVEAEAGQTGLRVLLEELAETSNKHAHKCLEVCGLLDSYTTMQKNPKSLFDALWKNVNGSTSYHALVALGAQEDWFYSMNTWLQGNDSYLEDDTYDRYILENHYNCTAKIHKAATIGMLRCVEAEEAEFPCKLAQYYVLRGHYDKQGDFLKQVLARVLAYARSKSPDLAKKLTEALKKGVEGNSVIRSSRKI